MRHTLRRLALVPVLGLTLSALVVPSSAGPDKIKYPEAWKTHVMYTTVDRYDIKQFRELYASSQAAVDAMKAGQPLPDGTVLTLVQYKAEVDAAGAPVKGANGRFVKGGVIALTVMEKRAGFGTEYPPELRNGDWEYAVFTPEGLPNAKANANNKACFTCHLPHAKQDFVISLAKLNNSFPGAQTLVKGLKGDVNIASFAFLPAKISAPRSPSTSRANTPTSAGCTPA